MRATFLFFKIAESVVASVVISVVDKKVCVCGHHFTGVLPPYKMVLVNVLAAVFKSRVVSWCLHQLVRAVFHDPTLPHTIAPGIGIEPTQDRETTGCPPSGAPGKSASYMPRASSHDEETARTTFVRVTFALIVKDQRACDASSSGSGNCTPIHGVRNRCPALGRSPNAVDPKRIELSIFRVRAGCFTI